MRESILKQSILVRMFVVAILGIVLLISVSLVGGLVYERQQRRNAAVREVSEKWGQSQTIVGPILTIPVRTVIRTPNAPDAYHTDYLHCLPDQLSIQAHLKPEIRYRGIYRIVLYSAQISLSSEFPSPDVRGYEAEGRTILWDEAVLTFGITDLTGVRSIGEVRWDTQELSPDPGLRSKDVVQSGLTFLPEITPGKDVSRFSFQMELNGSEQLQVTPVGRVTEFQASSEWGDPSFVGGFLPVSRSVRPTSFAATWRVLNLNRSFPQAWWNKDQDVAGSSFGVRLLLPLDEYQKTDRALKYAIMFILLIFVAFFMTEVLTQAAFHPIQYALVGFDLVLFYVLLLSFSEHVSFNLSYLVSSLAILTAVSLYVWAMTRRRSVTGLLASLVAVQYGFLFVLLQLEDWALLLGGIGLFVILGAVMFLTRRVDWFSLNKGSEKPPTISPSKV